MDHVPRRTPECVLAAVVLLPLAPWLTAGSVQGRFGGFATLKSVANLAALFGFAAWAASLVLASRMRPVERAVGGLDRLYGLHRGVGLLVVILATTHALFLTLYAGGNALDPYLPVAGWRTFTGVIALVLLIGFVVTSLVGRLPYQTFVLVQRLLGVAFILGAFHTFGVRGTAASSPALKLYLGLLTTAGVASLGYRLIGGLVGVGRHRHRVHEVRHLDENTVEITMAPVGRPLEFISGSSCTSPFISTGSPVSLTPSRSPASRFVGARYPRRVGSA